MGQLLPIDSSTLRKVCLKTNISQELGDNCKGFPGCLHKALMNNNLSHQPENSRSSFSTEFFRVVFEAKLGRDGLRNRAAGS